MVSNNCDDFVRDVVARKLRKLGFEAKRIDSSYKKFMPGSTGVSNLTTSSMQHTPSTHSTYSHDNTSTVAIESESNVHLITK